MKRLMKTQPRKTQPRLYVIAAFCAAVLLAACTTAHPAKPAPGQPPVLSEAARHGEQVFMAHCNVCHPEGEAGKGPSLVGKRFLPGFVIKSQVRMGLGGMPSFSRQEIDGPALKDVVAYIKALRQQKG